MQEIRWWRAALAAFFMAILTGIPAHTARGLSLEDAVREAFEANPSLRAAEQRVAAAQAAVDAAQSAWWPRLALAAGYEHSDNPPQAFMMRLNQGRLDMMDPAFDPNRTEGVGNASLAASAHILLYDGGARGLRRDLAAGAARAGRLRHESARNALAFEVVRAWYGVLRARAFLGVQEQSVESLAALLDTARERRDAGTAVETDVLNLDVRLAEAREDLIRAQNGVRLAVKTLNTTMGRDRLSIEWLPAVEEIMLPDPPADPGPDAYRLHPDWREAVAARDRADRAVRLARREGWPSVTAFGVARRDGEGFDSGRESYVAGITAEWELFTGFERQSGVRRAVAERDAVASDLDALGNRLRLEMREAELVMAEARERVGVAQRGAKLAAEAMRITAARYAEGSAPISELLPAQVADAGARMREVSARYDYCVALARLQRAQGVLAERFTDTRAP